MSVTQSIIRRKEGLALCATGFLLATSWLWPTDSLSAETNPTEEDSGVVQESIADDVKLTPGTFSHTDDDKPTYIKSENLTLRAEEKVFVYSGNVEVKQGDLTLTSDDLEGTYDDNNKVTKLVAMQHVVIVKGDSIRAKSERAVYEAATETITLTENPEMQQDGSVLTADQIIIYLDEDRSKAEGNVRVKIVKDAQAGAEEELALE